MSLTSFIQEKEVREKFLQTFSTPIIEANKPMLAPKVSFRHSMIGTAFDYLLRFYLERVNDGKIVKTEWIANKAMAYLDSENQLKAGKIIEGAKSCLENCLQSGFIANDLRTLGRRPSFRVRRSVADAARMPSFLRSSPPLSC